MKGKILSPLGTVEECVCVCVCVCVCACVRVHVQDEMNTYGERGLTTLRLSIKHMEGASEVL